MSAEGGASKAGSVPRFVIPPAAPAGAATTMTMALTRSENHELPERALDFIALSLEPGGSPGRRFENHPFWGWVARERRFGNRYERGGPRKPDPPQSRPVARTTWVVNQGRALVALGRGRTSRSLRARIARDNNR